MRRLMLGKRVVAQIALVAMVAASCAGGDAGPTTSSVEQGGDAAAPGFGTQDLWVIHRFENQAPDGVIVDLAALLLADIASSLGSAHPVRLGLQLEVTPARGGRVTDQDGSAKQSIAVSMGRLSHDPATPEGSDEFDLASFLLGGKDEVLVVMITADLQQDLVSFDNDDRLLIDLAGLDGAGEPGDVASLDYMLAQALPLADSAAEAGLSAEGTFAVRWRDSSIAFLGDDFGEGRQPALVEDLPVALFEDDAFSSLRGGNPIPLKGTVVGKLAHVVHLTYGAFKEGEKFALSPLGLALGATAQQIAAAAAIAGFIVSIWDIITNNDPKTPPVRVPTGVEGRLANPETRLTTMIRQTSGAEDYGCNADYGWRTVRFWAEGAAIAGSPRIIDEDTGKFPGTDTAVTGTQTDPKYTEFGNRGQTNWDGMWRNPTDEQIWITIRVEATLAGYGYPVSGPNGKSETSYPSKTGARDHKYWLYFVPARCPDEDGAAGTDDGSAGSDATSARAAVDDGVTVDATTEVVSDPAGHAKFIEMPSVLPLTLTSGSLVISGALPFVEVRGDWLADGSYTGLGSGTVAGFPGISVVFDGVITDAGVVGRYTMGSDGGLPGGQPIVYSIEASWPSGVAGDSTLGASADQLLADGLALYEQGDVFDALAAFDEAIRLDPTLASAYYSRGVLQYWDLAQATEALRDFEQAILLDPTAARPHYAAALVQDQAFGDAESAIAHLQAYLQLAPADAPERDAAEDLLEELLGG